MSSLLDVSALSKLVKKRAKPVRCHACCVCLVTAPSGCLPRLPKPARHSPDNAKHARVCHPSIDRAASQKRSKGEVRGILRSVAFAAVRGGGKKGRGDGGSVTSRSSVQSSFVAAAAAPSVSGSVTSRSSRKSHGSGAGSTRTARSNGSSTNRSQAKAAAPLVTARTVFTMASISEDEQVRVAPMRAVLLGRAVPQPWSSLSPTTTLTR